MHHLIWKQAKKRQPDLQLPEPITLLPFDGVLEKSTREYCSGIKPACTQFFPPWTTKGMKNFGRCFW